MTFKQFISIGSAPSHATFPKLDEYMLGMRFVVATIYGLSLGIRGYEGGMGLVLGGSLIYFIPLCYVESLLKADTSSYKGLHLKGFANAFAWLLLLWIALYSFQHSDTVQKFDDMAMAIHNQTNNVTTTVDSIMTEPETSTKGAQSSEF